MLLHGRQTLFDEMTSVTSVTVVTVVVLESRVDEDETSSSFESQRVVWTVEETSVSSLTCFVCRMTEQKGPFFLEMWLERRGIKSSEMLLTLFSKKRVTWFKQLRYPCWNKQPS